MIGPEGQPAIAACELAGGLVHAAPTRRTAHVRSVLMTADAVGGVWRYSLDLGEALAWRGTRTTLAVMGPPPSAAQRAEAERAGLTVIDRPYKLEWMDDPWHDVERAGAWLMTLQRTLRPGVVHLNGYAHAALPWSVPAIVVAHSCVRTWWRAVKGEAAPDRLEPYRSAVETGLARARAIVAPTRAMAGALAREYMLRGRVVVIPNGCHGRQVSEPAFAAKEPFVLSAGRAWDEAKNIAALADAASRIPWTVCVAGAARAPGGSTQSLAAVRALGHLPAEDLAGWYRRASIYVMPARYEPFGLSVLEAARTGCALVLGDIPSLREIWDGAAVFVAPDDRQALADRIQALIDNPDAREALGRAAYDRSARFTIERTADAYVDLYESLAA